jgi:hypothetical protein
LEIPQAHLSGVIVRRRAATARNTRRSCVSASLQSRFFISCAELAELLLCGVSSSMSK